MENTEKTPLEENMEQDVEVEETESGFEDTENNEDGDIEDSDIELEDIDDDDMEDEDAE